jgi:hypothetical protein
MFRNRRNLVPSHDERGRFVTLVPVLRVYIEESSIRGVPRSAGSKCLWHGVCADVAPRSSL